MLPYLLPLHLGLPDLVHQPIVAWIIQREPAVRVYLGAQPLAGALRQRGSVGSLHLVCQLLVLAGKRSPHQLRLIGEVQVYARRGDADLFGDRPHGQLLVATPFVEQAVHRIQDVGPQRHALAPPAAEPPRIAS
jgi:hypothetical protein